MKQVLVCALIFLLGGCATSLDEIAEPVSRINPQLPAYPVLSRRLSEEGTVVLRVYVQADGSVGKIEVQQSSGSVRLDGAGAEAAKSTEYRAARTRSGRNVSSWVSVPYKFVLSTSMAPVLGSITADEAKVRELQLEQRRLVDQVKAQLTSLDNLPAEVAGESAQLASRRARLAMVKNQLAAIEERILKEEASGVHPVAPGKIKE